MGRAFSYIDLYNVRALGGGKINLRIVKLFVKKIRLLFDCAKL